MRFVVFNYQLFNCRTSHLFGGHIVGFASTHFGMHHMFPASHLWSGRLLRFCFFRGTLTLVFTSALQLMLRCNKIGVIDLVVTRCLFFICVKNSKKIICTMTCNHRL